MRERGVDVTAVEAQHSTCASRCLFQYMRFFLQVMNVLSKTLQWRLQSIAKSALTEKSMFYKCSCSNMRLKKFMKFFVL